ncbi:hypothetical protein C5167_007526 [Papaver somniferum]|nr:hypothetical protein C5167_007526 [Papaver somniferum]
MMETVMVEIKSDVAASEANKERDDPKIRRRRKSRPRNTMTKRPMIPDFETNNRVHSYNVKSAAELEELEKIPKFKARPLNKKENHNRRRHLDIVERRVTTVFWRFLHSIMETQGVLIVASSLQIILGFSQVFEVTDLDKAAEMTIFGCFWTNSQIYSATPPLLLHVLLISWLLWSLHLTERHDSLKAFFICFFWFGINSTVLTFQFLPVTRCRNIVYWFIN